MTKNEAVQVQDARNVSVKRIQVVEEKPPTRPVEIPKEPRALIFDPIWYRKRYPDVAAAGINPVQHFLEHGAGEGRDPNPFFNTRHYQSSNHDVAASGMNPFLHYLFYGAREGREPQPPDQAGAIDDLNTTAVVALSAAASSTRALSPGNAAEEYSTGKKERPSRVRKARPATLS